MPISPSLIDKMHFGRLYDEQIADSYDEDVLGLLIGVRMLAIHQITATGVTNHPTILDLGVGTGETLRALAPQFTGARMIGIDLSARMIEIAQGKVAFEAHVDDACNAAAHVGPETVDLALAHFLTSFVDRPTLFRAARGTLKRGALFSIVSTPQAAFAKVRALAGTVIGPEAIAAVAPAPTEEQLAAEVRDAGFEIVATDVFRSTVEFLSFEHAVDWGMKSGFFAQTISAVGLERLQPIANLPGIFPASDEYVGVAMLARAT
jgi:predicted TPR repeat methyltransferase